MARDITIADINYNDVPSIKVPLLTSGYATYADTSDADAVAGDISLGKTAYVDGVKITGTGTGGGGGGEYDIIATISGDTQSLAIVDAEHVITIEPLSVTANGTYTAPTDHAYTPVTVNVPATPTQTKTETITSNGTTTITPDSGYNLSSVSVITNVPNPSTGTITIVANGTYDVTNYASANVDVVAPTILLQDKTIVANGTYTADSGYDGLGTVSVDVSGGATKNFFTSYTTDVGNPGDILENANNALYVVNDDHTTSQITSNYDQYLSDPFNVHVLSSGLTVSFKNASKLYRTSGSSSYYIYSGSNVYACPIGGNIESYLIADNSYGFVLKQMYFWWNDATMSWNSSTTYLSYLDKSISPKIFITNKSNPTIGIANSSKILLFKGTPKEVEEYYNTMPDTTGIFYFIGSGSSDWTVHVRGLLI